MNTQSALDEMPQAVAGIDVRPAGLDTLAYHPATGRVHVLNSSAARVLLRSDGATPLSAMIDDIVSATGANRARVERDVVAIFADFRSKDLLS